MSVADDDAVGSRLQFEKDDWKVATHLFSVVPFQAYQEQESHQAEAEHPYTQHDSDGVRAAYASSQDYSHTSVHRDAHGHEHESLQDSYASVHLALSQQHQDWSLQAVAVVAQA